MRYTSLLPATLPIIIVLLLTGCGKPAPVEPPKIGDAAPPAEIVSLDNRKTSLSSLSGKLVIVHFWATWCAPCRKEMPSLERLAKKLDPSRIVLLGISVDEDTNLVEEFKLKYGIRFANHIDSDMAIARGKFGASAFPETFIVGRDGRILRHMVGGHEWDSPAMLQVLEDAYAGVQTRSGAYW